MRIRLYHFIFLLLIISTISLLYSISIYHNLLGDKQAKEDLTDYYSYLGIVYNSIMTDGYSIKNKVFNDYLEHNNLTDSTLLVVKYSYLGCASCTKNIIQIIEDRASKLLEKNKILFVVSDAYGDIRPRPNTLFLPDNDILGLPPEMNKLPIVFVYDGTRVLHSIVPEEDRNEIFNLFLETICDKYF